MPKVGYLKCKHGDVILFLMGEVVSHGGAAWTIDGQMVGWIFEFLGLLKAWIVDAKAINLIVPELHKQGFF